MVIVMDMSTGKYEKLNREEVAVAEYGSFADEVLNAGWLPQPQARLETLVATDRSAAVGVEAGKLLHVLSCNQG